MSPDFWLHSQPRSAKNGPILRLLTLGLGLPSGNPPTPNRTNIHLVVPAAERQPWRSRGVVITGAWEGLDLDQRGHSLDDL